MDIKKIEEVEKKKQQLALGGGAAAIEKMHAKAKLTASERMDKLFDLGTFRELYRWAKPLKTGFDIDEIGSPRAGMVAGYGEIQGRMVYSAAFDFTVHGGSQNAIQMVKLGKVMQQARDEGVPFVYMVDSGGRQIQDQFGPWGLRGPTRVHAYEEAFDMFSPPLASGVIPQVSLMLGPCYAGTAYSPIMADFVFFRKETSFMSLASPALLKTVTFADVTQDEIGGAVLHATTTGSCDLLAETDEESLAKCRQLLSFLPSNWREKPPFFDCGDAANRREERLPEIVPGDPSRAYDIHQVISLLVDKGDFFELAAMHAGNMVIGFARLAGQPVGIVANNPAVADGAIDTNACDKAARFIRTCDCFSVPLLFLVDTPGFPASVELEQSREGLERHAAKPLFAFCEATVPRIVFYLRRCYGSGRMVMGTKEMGADAALAWPTAELRLAGEKTSQPYQSGEVMAVDDIIDPRDTRPLAANILRRLAKKQEPVLPWRKHGLIPL